MTSGLHFLIAEFLLFFGAIFSLGVSAFADSHKAMRLSHNFTVPFIVMIAVYLVAGGTGGGTVFTKELLIVDGLSQYAKFLVLLMVSASVFIAGLHLKDVVTYKNEHRADYFTILLLSAVGIFVMVSANDLMSFYMGLEIQSLALYILIAFNRDCSQSVEAALKYLILGALGSGLFLFGTSLIYGVVGSVTYDAVNQFGVVIGGNMLFLTGVALILMALFFKLSAAPFHMWTPDVYQGASSFVTAFIATAPKIAAVIGFLRLVGYVFEPVFDKIDDIIMMASLLSLVIGAVMAVRQTSLYRMAAYSTITHMGYILLAMAVKPEVADKIVLEYMTVYVLSSFALFSLLGALRISGRSVDNMNDLAGLGKQNPVFAVMLTILMFSLAGIPPLAGFFVKFSLLSHVIAHDVIIPAVIAVLASAVSAFYYLRVIKIMYFDMSDVVYDAIEEEHQMIAIICVIPLLLYMFMPNFVQGLISHFMNDYTSIFH